MDVDISISEYCLEDSSCVGIYFLDTIEATFGDSTRKCRNLLYTDNAWIGDDEEIELIVDPVEEDKGKERNPIDRNTSPIDSLISDYVDNGELIGEKHPRRNNEREEIEKMINKYYPVSMKCHYDLLIVFKEGNVFFFDHVMCGSLR